MEDRPEEERKSELTLSQQAARVDEGITGVPRFKVDLDEPASTRWTAVANEYKQELLSFRNDFREEIASIIGGIALKILDSVGSIAGPLLSLFVKYSDEIKGFAKLVNMPFKDIMMIQFMYEVCAACTSIVVPEYGENGEPTHIRTMDWELPELKALTIEVEFWKNGEPLFVTTTWPGYIGVFTGMRYNCFSSSVNFRCTGESYLNNLRNAVSYDWPIGFLLRAVLQEDGNYAQAVASLSGSNLIAPVYFTCCGTKPGEGCIITRNRSSELNRWEISEHGPAVQSNIDHWSNDENEDILYSIQRRELGREKCNNLGEVSKEKMFDILSEFPILNDLTVSATWMCPSTGEFETRLPNSVYGFNPSPTAAPFGGDVRVNCGSCKRRFNPKKNVTGQCSHVGKWHDSFSSCGISCARVGLNVGKCHWSCCYSVNRLSPCPKSPEHNVPNY